MSRSRFALPFVLVLACLSGALLVLEKVRQRNTIATLLKHEFVAVQFGDGTYVESLADVHLQNWLFDTVDVVYFDTPHISAQKYFSDLKHLPSLSRVVIRFQGDDAEEFRARRGEIREQLASERETVARAFPDLEIFTTWAVVESSLTGNSIAGPQTPISD